MGGGGGEERRRGRERKGVKNNTNKITETKGQYGDLQGFPCSWVHQGRSGPPTASQQCFLFFHIWDGKQGQNPMTDNTILTPWGASALMEPMQGCILRQSWIKCQPRLYQYIDGSFEEMDKKIVTASNIQEQPKKIKKKKK
jgi:hypothetical protein